MVRFVSCWLTALLLALPAPAQEFLPLWPAGIPCANQLEMEVIGNPKIGQMLRKVHEPGIEVYLPPAGSANGTGVLICPGGGYSILAWDWEGTEVARWFSSFGVAAFVLRYRLPQWEADSCRHRVALDDAQRAIRLIRSRAADWGVDSGRLGIMGFSAGGHLASTAGTRFNPGIALSSDPLERLSCRPDFMILMYPVISMDSTFAHMGSRRNLIGNHPSDAMIRSYSSELQVTAQTPPTLLVHASDDEGVPPENSIRFYQALLRHRVPASLLLYPSGGHGFSFALDKQGTVRDWPSDCRRWMQEMGYLPR